jgi:23S rRNA pseudouridine2605 synthase
MRPPKKRKVGRNEQKPLRKGNKFHQGQQKKPTQDRPDVRLNKYIADAGVCSRREADKLIAAGEITVNGKVETNMGTRVTREDVVKYKGEALRKERFVYILINKPKDFITTMNDDRDRKTVLDLIDGACKERVYPVGRLDRNTTGLLLMTNDGELTKRLTHPSYNVTKIYVAELDKKVAPEHLEQLEKGFELEDGFTKFDSAEYDQKTGARNIVVVKIHSGKNRIVRRTFEHLGYDVRKLDRIQFASLKKGALTRGKWRFLNRKEVGFLKMVK